MGDEKKRRSRRKDAKTDAKRDEEPRDYVYVRPPPCPECQALGHFEHDGIGYELYFCLTRLHSIPIVDPEWPTVLARRGDGPRDVKDGIALAERDPVLGEAKRRAIERGLYDPEKPLHPGMIRFVEALADLLVADLLEHPDIGSSDAGKGADQG